MATHASPSLALVTEIQRARYERQLARGLIAEDAVISCALNHIKHSFGHMHLSWSDCLQMVQYLQACPSNSWAYSVADVGAVDQPLIYVSDGFENMSGYTNEECVGRNCRFLQTPQTNRTVTDHLRESIQHQRACCVRLLNETKGGTLFWNLLYMARAIISLDQQPQQVTLKVA